MKPKLILMAFGIMILCLSSCASPHQNAIQAIQIDSDFRHAKIQYNDSLYDVPAIITAKKEMPNVPFTLILDTVKKEMKINERDIFDEYLIFGQIYDDLVNTLNGRHNKFPKNAYIQDIDTALVTNNYELADLGLRNYRSISLHFGAPILSMFYSPRSTGENRKTMGMMGLSAGVEFVYSWKRAILFNAKLSPSDFFTLYGGTLNYSYSLCHAYTSSKYSFLYGLNYNYYRFQSAVYGTKYKYAQSLGATVGFFVKRHLTPFFAHQTGITFSPSFYQMTPIGNAFKYNYSVLLEMQFMLNILKWHR